MTQLPADIAALVPHRDTMLLLDRCLSADDDSATIEATVRPGQPFVTDTGMPAWVGIEYMAQAIAAWSGAQACRNGTAPDIGFLLGTRRYEASVPLFPHGSVLHITICKAFIADNGIGMFDCRIVLDDAEVASGSLSVFQPEDPASFLQGTTHE